MKSYIPTRYCPSPGRLSPLPLRFRGTRARDTGHLVYRLQRLVPRVARRPVDLRRTSLPRTCTSPRHADAAVLACTDHRRRPNPARGPRPDRHRQHDRARRPRDRGNWGTGDRLQLRIIVGIPFPTADATYMRRDAKQAPMSLLRVLEPIDASPLKVPDTRKPSTPSPSPLWVLYGFSKTPFFSPIEGRIAVTMHASQQR